MLARRLKPCTSEPLARSRKAAHEGEWGGDRSTSHEPEAASERVG